jgi:hypothetical protein
MIKYYLYDNIELAEMFAFKYNYAGNLHIDIGDIASVLEQTNSIELSDIILIYRNSIEFIEYDFLEKNKNKKIIIVGVLERLELRNSFYKNLIDLNINFKIVDANPFFKEWLQTLYNYNYPYKVYSPNFYLNTFNFSEFNKHKFTNTNIDRQYRIVSLNNKQKELRDIITFLFVNNINITDDIFYQYVGSNKGFSEINLEIFNRVFFESLDRNKIITNETDFTKYILNNDFFKIANKNGKFFWDNCIEKLSDGYLNILLETNAQFEATEVNKNYSTAVSEKFLYSVLANTLPIFILNSNMDNFYNFFGLVNNNQIKYNTNKELLESFTCKIQEINTLSLNDCKELHNSNIKSITYNSQTAISLISDLEKIHYDYNYIFNNW